MRIIRLLQEIIEDRSAASAAEYAILLAILGTGIAVAALNLGQAISAALDYVGAAIATCASQC